MKFEIYCIENLVNGKKYIGKTQAGIENRFQTHLAGARNGWPYALHRAIRKYGPENFSVRKIHIGELRTKEECNQAERDAIFLFNTIEEGYNLTPGGDGGEAFTGRRHSPETIAKMRATKTGFKHSEETRAKMRVRMLGTKHTSETRAKIGAGNRGKVVSAASRKQMSESHKKRWQTGEPQNASI